ncbi:hypothetical protein OK016_08510 [Vibrio chagasii]|nr:hypothetical protein [Vibrio chagasii]
MTAARDNCSRRLDGMPIRGSIIVAAGRWASRVPFEQLHENFPMMVAGDQKLKIFCTTQD